jgi:hypothetical protein
MEFLRFSTYGTKLPANTMNHKFRLALVISSLLVFLAFLMIKLIQPRVNYNKNAQNDKTAKPQLIRKNDVNPQQMDSKDAQEYMDLAKKIFSDKTDKETFQRDGVAFKVRVVDQFGDPVVDAIYSATYQKGFDSQNFTLATNDNKTDENGIFNVAINTKISGIWIAAQKKGYYQIKGKSDKSISMITAQRLTDNLTIDEKDRWKKIQEKIDASYNTLENILDEQGVVTLTMKKMSDYDKMYQNMFSYSVNARDLDERLPGKYMMEYRNHNFDGIVPADAHVIQIGPIFYDKAKEKELNIRYSENRGGGKTPAAPWYSEMSIPGGGFYLIDEKEEPDGDLYQSRYSADAKEGAEFLAPESGYLEKVRAEMPESRMDESWRPAFTKNYYVKFPDNTYGRIKVVMSRGSYNITSWYNPTGRRNTEFCLDDDLDVKYIEKKR